MSLRRQVLAGVGDCGGRCLVVQIHQPRAWFHEGTRHAGYVPFGSLVVGGHDREQFHEFLEEVDHAKWLFSG